MYTLKEIDRLLDSLCSKITISGEMFDTAKKEYEALGNWIDKVTPDYKAHIYTQGSFALGTVIKPISEEDDYDIDLVCELERDYGLSAKIYKLDVSKRWLTSFKKHSKELEEKRRCWHVEYDDVPNFHMDVIPAYKLNDDTINITEHDEEKDEYKYIKSNPKGYISWFFSRCDVASNKLFESYVKDQKVTIKEAAEIQSIKRNKLKTTLQKAIILLKRHRDLMFENDLDNKPISIIITTLAALSYNNSESICDTLEHFFSFVPSYLESNKNDGTYVVSNPIDKSDNFANKWIEFPERKEAFFRWLTKAKKDLCYLNMKDMDRVTLGKHVQKMFGEKIGIAIYEKFAQESRESITSGKTKVDTKKGILSSVGVLAIPSNHHHEE